MHCSEYDSGVVSQSKVLVVITARAGSKGIKNKNLISISSVPILAFPINFIKEESPSCEVVVSTDSNDIANLAVKLGAGVYRRSDESATDFALTETILTETLKWKESQNGFTYDYCIFLTATSLFRPKGIYQRALNYLESHPSCESYFTAFPTTKNFWYKNEKNEWNRIFPWMATYGSRQTRTPIYREDTGIFSMSRAKLWRNGKRIGDQVEVEIFDDDFSNIDLHGVKDLILAEAAIRYNSEIQE